MPTKKKGATRYTLNHKDGTRMRSGTFENGQQVGQWTTYDQKGQVYKVTTMKAKPNRQRK
jgi:antitoxin component YwqK of YwqJK toxin-antitoxin module